LEVEVQTAMATEDGPEEAASAALEVEVQTAMATEDGPEEAAGAASQSMEAQMSCLSDDEGDQSSDLEDMFDFDPERLAQLVKNGASKEELAGHLQEEYAGALEERLETKAKPPELEDLAHEAMGDIDTLMTPTATPTGAAGKPSNKLKEEERRSERQRRSLAIQHRPSAAQRGEAAVQVMEAFGRRSLARAEGASAEEREQLACAVAQAARRVSNRHRRSVTKAAEVLEEVAEASNVPLEKWSEEQVDSQVELIQSAMDEAFKRHTQSITAAVQSVTSGTKEKTSSTESASVQDRISKAVAAAYERRNADNSWYPQWPHGEWYGEEDQWQQQAWHDGEEWSSYEATWEQSWGRGQWQASESDQFEAAGQDWQDMQLQNWQATNQVQDTPPGFEKAPAGFESGLHAPWRYGSA